VRKPRLTKTERLQAAWDKDESRMVAAIEFRPFDGWYAVPQEPRHFGDEGEPLGRNFEIAMEFIKWLADR
jgi:hypothetical protein